MFAEELLCPRKQHRLPRCLLRRHLLSSPSHKSRLPQPHLPRPRFPRLHLPKPRFLKPHLRRTHLLKPHFLRSHLPASLLHRSPRSPTNPTGQPSSPTGHSNPSSNHGQPRPSPGPPNNSIPQFPSLKSHLPTQDGHHHRRLRQSHVTPAVDSG